MKSFAHCEIINLAFTFKKFHGIIALILQGGTGADMGYALLLQNLLGAGKAKSAGIIAVVIGGEQQIKVCVLQGIYDAIRAIEKRITAVIAFFIAAQGNLQVCYRKIHLHY